MLYKFRSKAAGDVIMLEAGGDLFQRLIGKTPQPRGILEPVHMEAALAALQRAVDEDDACRSQAREDADDRAQAPGPAGGDRVSLRQRMWPMMQMIRRCRDEEQPIVWGV